MAFAAPASNHTLETRRNLAQVAAAGIALDAKDFGVGAQILHDLDIAKIRLLSNSTQTKRVGLVGYGLEIVDYVNY